MSQLDCSLPPSAVFPQLSAVVQKLIVVCHTLYAGSWDDCAEDIRRRQNGQPYLFRLNFTHHFTVPDIFAWVSCLKNYEQTRGETFAATALAEFAAQADISVPTIHGFVDLRSTTAAQASAQSAQFSAQFSAQ
jgi:hypothetical protein